MSWTEGDPLGTHEQQSKAMSIFYGLRTISYIFSWAPQFFFQPTPLSHTFKTFPWARQENLLFFQRILPETIFFQCTRSRLYPWRYLFAVFFLKSTNFGIKDRLSDRISKDIWLNLRSFWTHLHFRSLISISVWCKLGDSGGSGIQRIEHPPRYQNCPLPREN